MSKRLIICKLMIVAIALMNMPVSQAKISAADSNIQISSYQKGLAEQAEPVALDQPTAADSIGQRVNEGYRVPLSFEPNQGQTEPQVKFLSRRRGYTLFLTATEAVVSMRNGKAARAFDQPQSARADRQSLMLRMKLVGANPAPRVTGETALPGKVNYVRGKDPKGWRAGIPTYARVRYEDTYPGVDLIYYSNGQDLEYDFVVAAGADPDRIRLRFTGADKLAVNARGELVLHTAAGELRQPKPVIYQETDGVRRLIPGGYVLTGASQVGFRLGTYDRARPLIIDPVLVYSTYFGGSGEDAGMDIAVDDDGNAYVTGTRPSVRFPDRQNFDAFVAKFSPAGVLLWVTDLGDRCDDEGRGVAVDREGNAYVTGQIGGICYPYPELRPGAFVAKLNGATGGVLYLFPFSGEFGIVDVGQAVAVDREGNAHVTGVTSSADFPVTPGALQPAFGGGITDGFVVKVSASGSALLYATYLGGDWSESANDIAVDGEGNAYVTGSTGSRNFPTRNAYQPIPGWDGVGTSGFVSKLNAAGSELLYSTYLGGRFNDIAVGIAVDSAGHAYVSGVAESDNFPTTPGSFQPEPADNRLCYYRLCTDAFVTKLNASGTALVYSTYLGGRIFDEGSRIAVDAAGNAYLTGMTNSSNFPTRDAFQPNLADEGQGDAFVVKLNANGSALIYSSYLGGGRVVGTDPFEGVDVGSGIAVDAEGRAYVTGQTYSANFPVTPGAHQPTYGGGVGCGFLSSPCGDAFVTKIGDAGAPPPVREILYAGPEMPIPDDDPAGVQIPITVTDFPGAIGDLNFRLDGNVCTTAPGATTVGLDHTWVGDLVITLTSPQGTTVTLMIRPGGVNNDGRNFCQTLLDDEGGGPSIQTITPAGAPHAGRFRPATPLAAFRGEDPNGTWVLNVSDSAAQDVGNVRAFRLVITGRS